MLLIALLCQVTVDLTIERESRLVGAITISEPYWLSRSTWNPVTAAHAIEDDPGLKTLWMMPVARVNGELITSQDVLFYHAHKLLAERDENTSEQFANYWQHWIETKLPHAIRQAALWTAIRQECPPELFEEFWQRHEQSWAEMARSAAKNRAGLEPMPENWKPYWIRYYVMQDYFDLKFGPASPRDVSKSATDPMSSRELQIEEFQKDVWSRAKVETAYHLAESPKKLQPGEAVRPTSRQLPKAK